MGGRVAIEEIVPELAPDRPVMASGHELRRGRGQRTREQSLRRAEPVFAAEPEVERRWWRMQALQVAPDVPLVIVLGERAGAPAPEPALSGDLGGDDAAAQIWGDQAQAVGESRMTRGATQCHESAQ